MAIGLSMGALGFAQETFDNIPLGEGYYLNKVIASPPSVYETGDGDLTTDDAGNTRISQELTLEYYEFRGTPDEIVPSDLYFVNIEGDGEGTATTMGRVDEAIQLGDGVRRFGSNGLLAIVSNYTDTNTDVVTTNQYASLLEGTGTTVITIELQGTNVQGSNSASVTSFSPDIGYDGNIEDFAVSYMLIQAPEDPQGHDLDSDNDGVIDATGDHTSWTLYDSVAYLDNDDQLVDNSGNDTGEYGYAQLIFARDLDLDPVDGNADSYKTTTSATVIPVSGGNISFFLRQGLKTGATTNDWIAAAVADGPFPGWTFSGNTSRVFPNSFAGYSMPTSIYGALNPVEVNTWNGSASSDWDDATNWDLGIVPVKGSVLTIDSSSNDPVVGSTSGANAQDVTVNTGASLTVASGGSLIVPGTAMGEITYNVNVADTNFHLIASPVSGQSYDDTWVTDNSIASGSVSTSNRGIASYSNATTTNTWSYFQGGGTAQQFMNGVGYALKRTVAGDYNFTGSYPALEASLAIGQGASNWNLVGNTAPAYLDVASLLSANAENITPEFQAVYVYDGMVYTAVTSGYLTPGQAYFVNSSVATGNLTITEDMLGHNVSSEAKNTQAIVSLNVSNGSAAESTEIIFNNEASLGLDPGQDLGKFTGVASDLSLYTELVAESKGISFGKQTLPNSEGAVIPVGLVAKSGEEVTFSVDSQNIEGVELYLEDKANGSFVNLSEGTYKITLDADVNGVGQFYLHTAAQKSLSTDDIIESANSIDVYVANNSLVVTGLNGESATVSVYAITGAQVVNGVVTTGNVNLPSLNTGIYIVNIKSDLGEISKKVILE